jgi:hypothetical protein
LLVILTMLFIHMHYYQIIVPGILVSFSVGLKTEIYQI